MRKVFVCSKNKIIRNPSNKQIASHLKKSKNTVWVDLYKPEKKDYEFLQDAFGFHPLSLEDCEKSNELPKIDVYEDYLFIILHSATSDKKDLGFGMREIDFFLGKNFLVTIHKHKSTSVEHLAKKLAGKTNTRKNGKNGKHASATPDFMMYQLIDYFVDLYFPLLDEWGGRIEVLEEAVIKNKSSQKLLREMMRIKREVTHLRKSLAAQRDVISRLTKTDLPFISTKTHVYFSDVYDHILRLYTEIETQRDLVNTTFEAHMSVLSNQMAETSNKMNQVMQKLTVIATIFMPLTFIAGVYGMNFRYMPELYWKYGYYIILGIMLVIAVLMYLFFRKRKWM